LRWLLGAAAGNRAERGGRWVDVLPNWKEALGTIDDWRGNNAMPGGDD